MINKSSKQIHALYFLTDLALISAVFFFTYLFKYNNFPEILAGLSNYEVLSFPDSQEYLFAFFLWAIFLVISLKRRNLYLSDRNISIPKEISRVIMSVTSASILIGAIIFFAQYKFFSRMVFVGCYVLLCVMLSLWRTIKRVILRRLILEGFHNINILIVGNGQIGKFVYDEVKKNPYFGFHVVGYLDETAEGEIDGVPVLGKMKDFTYIAKKYFVDEIIITNPVEKNSVARLIQEARDSSVGVRIVPDSFEGPLEIINFGYLGVLPLVTYRVRQHHPSELALKRIFDFLISLTLLICLSPLFIIIAALVKLDSFGRVIFCQARVGLKGREFCLYKFRSMVDNAEDLKTELMGQNEVKEDFQTKVTGIFKIKNDPRVTKVGAFLRKYSLDELPQLINVLKGDMSLVGPRPPTPDEVQKYALDHMKRLSIRPGITGLSQVRSRSDLSFRRWVRWDLWYINNWSFRLDLDVLLRTVPAVLKGRGAY